MNNVKGMTGAYLLALGLLVLLSLGSYVILRRNIAIQEYDAELVNISGRQRMLSQRIALYCMRLSAEPDARIRRTKLAEAAALMEASHERLLGRAKAGPSGLRAVYLDPPRPLHPQVRDFLRDAAAVARLPEEQIRPGNPGVGRVLIAAAGPLPEALDAAVREHQRAAEEHVARLQRLERGVLAVTLSVLAMTGLFIFRPMTSRIQEEQEALEEINTTLERRVAERSEQIARLRDSYVHNINHELRTPIACITASLQALREETDRGLGSRGEKFFAIALRNAQRLNIMLDDLLEVARLESGKVSLSPRRVPVPPLLDDIVASMRLISEEKGIRVEAGAREDLPPVLADPLRLEEVLVNLIHNAIKFTPEGGRIAVKAGPYAGDRGLLLFEVQDSGVGIEPQAIPKLFNRLYQADPRSAQKPGLGIGLYLCKELVLRQGGTIWVESEPGRGSRFSFTLPLWRDHGPETAAG